MHAYFGIGHLDYEGRKEAVERITKQRFSKMLKQNKQINDYIESLYRKHDLCDAFCIMIYFVEKEREKYRVNNLSKQVAERLRENNIDLDSFRYVPSQLSLRN
jgi:hypothetical protein